MNLKAVLNGIEGLKAKGNLDIDVKGIAHDSRKVKEGYMFVAIKGFETDGHKYVKQAVESGAKVIVIEDISSIKKSDIEEDTIILPLLSIEALAISALPKSGICLSNSSITLSANSLLSVTKTALAILSCSACESKSAATFLASQVPSAITRISDGPAIISIETIP